MGYKKLKALLSEVFMSVFATEEGTTCLIVNREVPSLSSNESHRFKLFGTRRFEISRYLLPPRVQEYKWEGVGIPLDEHT